MLPYWTYTGRFSDARILPCVAQDFTRPYTTLPLISVSQSQRLNGHKGSQSARVTSGKTYFQCRSENSGCIRQASGTGRRMTTV